MIKKESFSCRRDLLWIKGMQFIPEEKREHKKYPAIICSHGFTGNYLGMEDYCELLCKEGYATFCYSFCGGGSREDDPAVKSDGDSREMSIYSEVKDLCAVIEYVQTIDYVDCNQISLLGTSQGGFVSALAAAKLGDLVKQLIMIFPALCIPDHARRGILGGSHYDPLNVPEEIDCGRTILGRAFHDEVCVMDPYLEMSVYKGPVLIIHGDEDEVVEYSYSIRAKDAYEKGQCSLQIVRNMGHWTNDHQLAGVMASIRQFLSGKRELFAFRIIITHTDRKERDGEIHFHLYFTGYCESDLFTGTILPGGEDHQIWINEEVKSIRAEYTFDGIDSDKKRCNLHVVNQWGGNDWKPVIHTSSKALSWLHGADLTAVLESGEGGPTIRVFADLNDIPS